MKLEKNYKVTSSTIVNRYFLRLEKVLEMPIGMTTYGATGKKWGNWIQLE